MEWWCLWTWTALSFCAFPFFTVYLYVFSHPLLHASLCLPMYSTFHSLACNLINNRFLDIWKLTSLITAGGGVNRWGSSMVRRPIVIVSNWKTQTGPSLFVDLWNGKGHVRKVAPPRVKPRASGLSCQHSATELRWPPAATPPSCP